MNGSGAKTPACRVTVLWSTHPTSAVKVMSQLVPASAKGMLKHEKPGNGLRDSHGSQHERLFRLMSLQRDGDQWTERFSAWNAC